MRKLISWLAFTMAFCLVLLSCVHDEIYTPSDPASKEYHSKSLWKEDEKYIKNVIKVYSEHHEEIKKGAGEPIWDYAMTMDRFDESFLMVPVAENGKVVAVLNVPRKGQKVYFTYTQVQNDMEFFQNLMSSRLKRAGTTLVDNTAGKLVCTTKTISMFYPDNESDPDGPGHWESHHVTECKSQQLESCVGEVLPDGTCLGGGGNDPGYPYPGGGGEDPQPEPEQPEDPCEKMKAQNQNQGFKDKVAALDKDEVFKEDKEKGYSAAYGTVPYESLANSSNGNVRFPEGNKYFGYMHTHLNMEGVVKIFSPYDVATFLTSCVANAKLKGNMTDAYAMVITSEGNYILKYSGDGNFAVTVGQLESWKSWYEKEYTKLIDKNLLTQSNVEKIFTQFLQEEVNINGLEVYKSEKNTGTSSKLQYNGTDNPVQSIPCPQ